MGTLRQLRWMDCRRIVDAADTDGLQTLRTPHDFADRPPFSSWIRIRRPEENSSNPTSKGSSGCLCARCGADRAQGRLNHIPSLELDSGAMQNSDVTLVHASYPADRRYMLTAHFGCRLLERDQDLWLTDCDTTAASSGGPVFVQRNGNLKLAAIMVGVAGTSGSVAVPIANWIDAVARRDCP